MKTANKKNTNQVSQLIKNASELKLLILVGSPLPEIHNIQLSKCKQLIKLDLSECKISNLFPMPQSLQHLNLHSNHFQHLSKLSPMFNLNLTYLTLFDNPITNNSYAKIRHFIVNIIKSLKILDFHIVVQSQRDMKIGYPQPMSDKVYVGYPLLIYPIGKTQDQYLFILSHQINLVNQFSYQAKAEIIIQRWWRNIRYKLFKKTTKKSYSLKFKTISPQISKGTITLSKQLKPFSSRKQNQNQLNSLFRQWKKQTKKMKQLRMILKKKNNQHLNQNLTKYQLHKLQTKLSKQIKYFVKRIQQKVTIRKACKKIISYYRIKKLFFNSDGGFYLLLDLNKYKKFYFKKTQRFILKNIIDKLQIRYKKQGRSLQIQKQYSISNCYNLMGLRLIQSQRIIPRSTFLVNYLYPSIKSLILIRGKQQQKKRVSKKLNVKIKTLNYHFRQLCKVTKQQMQRSMVIYNRLTNYVKKQYYNSLLVFQVKQDSLLKDIFSGIAYHNKYDQIQLPKKKFSFLENPNQKFCFFVDKQVERVSAAIKIQRTFRGYLSNKNSKLNLIQKISQKRGAMLIQRWFRNLKYQHKYSFFIQQQFYIKSINSKQLYLHFDLYKCLASNESMLSKESLRFREQQGSILTSSIEGMIYYEWQQQKKIFPCFIAKQLKNSIKNSNITPQSIGELIHLIHLGNKVQIISVQGVKFLKIIFKDIDDAKYRACILALQTYRFWYNGHWIKLFQKSQLCQDSILRYQAKMSQIYKVKFQRTTNKILLHFSMNQKAVFVCDVHQKTKIKKILTCNKPIRVQQTSLQFYNKQSNHLAPQKISTVLFAFLFPSIYKSQGQIDTEVNNTVQVIEKQKQSIQINTVNIEIKKADTGITFYKGNKSERLKARSVHFRKNHIFNKTLLEYNPKQQQKKQIYTKQKVSKIKDLQLQLKQTLKQNQRQLNQYRIIQRKRNKFETKEQIQRKNREDYWKKRKLVQKVKDRQDRSRDSQRKSFTEGFMQKNNFLAKQHFLMNIQKQKNQSLKSKKQLVHKNYLSAKESMQKKLSFNQQVKNRDISFDGSVIQLQKKIQVQVIQKVQKKPQQKSAYKIGLDDESLANLRKLQKSIIIHAVFPQQFFPIQRKQNNIFPKI